MVQSERPADLKRVQLAIFDARHSAGARIGKPEVLADVLSGAGVDGAGVVDQILADRRWLNEVRAQHEEAASMGVFGVPSLGFPGAVPMFVRLREVPVGRERAVEVYRRVREAAIEPVINELKRPLA